MVLEKTLDSPLDCKDKREVVKIPLRPILLAKKRCKTTEASPRRHVCMFKGLRPTFTVGHPEEACESQHE